MFVTREEQEPLGGLIGYWLPVSLAAMLAIACGGAAFWLDRLPAPEYLSFAEAAGLSAGLGGGFAALFFLGGAGRWRAALLAGLAVGLLIGLESYAGGERFLPLAWLAATALAAGIIDRRGAGKPLIPAWHIVFARLASLPLTLLFLCLIAGLVAIPLASVLEITGELDRSGEATSSLPGGLVSGALIIVLGVMAAFVRRQRVMLGAVRYALIWAARFILPVIVVIGLVVLVTRPGTGGPLLPALIAMTVVLVYQTGETRRAPIWLMVFTALAPLVMLGLLWPAFAYLIDNGLTQARLQDLGGTVLTALLALMLLAGAVSQAVPGQKRWMAPLAPLLTIYVGVIAVWPLIAALVRTL